VTTTDCHRPTSDHDRADHDPARTGAVWVTGTGAFLLLAAAAVFVAVRWGEIPASAKLAAIGALTGGFLLAGRRLRADLPATAGALFHLGAFLVPVDVAAVAVRAELGWGQLLLAEGLVCGLTFGLAARAERSVVLRWAAAAAVVVAAAGVGTVGPVPAPLVLAVAAVAALLADRQLLATAWAGAAGLAPVAGFALAASDVAPGVLERLGLAGSEPRLAAVVTGAATAGVLATVARRRLDPALALLAAGCLATGVVVTGAEMDPSPWAWTVAAAGALTLVEGVALLSRRDRFWGPRIGLLADAAEVLAVPGTAAAAAVVLVSPLALVDGAHAAASSALLAALWVVADLRRRSGDGTPVAAALLLGGRFLPATIGIAACVPAAVCLATASGPLTAGAMVATAAALAVGGRPGAPGAAAVLAALAPLAVVAHRANDLFGSGPQSDDTVWLTLVAVAAGVAGSLLLARMASWRTTTPPVGGPATAATTLLAVSAPLPVGIAGLVASGTLAGPGVVLLAATALLWLVSAAADGAPARRGELLWQPGTATRATALALVLGACRGVDPWEAVVVSAVAALLVVVDALRRGEPGLAIGLAAAVTIGAVSAGTAAGLPLAQTGVALAVTALVTGGIGSVAPSRWAPERRGHHRDPLRRRAGPGSRGTDGPGRRAARDRRPARGRRGPRRSHRRGNDRRAWPSPSAPGDTSPTPASTPASRTSRRSRRCSCSPGSGTATGRARG
jgi:hypothetical protein